jgi:integrase
MIDGKRYRGSTQESTLSRARQVESILITRAREGSGLLQRRKPMTLREFSGRFLAFVRDSNRLQPKSKDYYENGWDVMGDQPIAGMRIDRITSQDADTIKIDGSPAKVNRSLRTLRRMLHLAVEWEYIAKAPRIHLLQETGRSLLIEAKAETELAAHIEGAAKVALVLIMDAGLRPNEVVHLRVEDVNFTRGTLNVTRGKTKKSARFVPISERVREVLGQQIGERKDGWVFPSSRYPGEPIQRHALTSAFAIARRKAGLPSNLKLYNARHTFATDIMAASGNVFLLKALMGHTDVKTLDRYSIRASLL